MALARSATMGLGLLGAGLLAPAAGAQEAALSLPLGSVYEPGAQERVARAEDLSRFLPALEVHPAFLTDPNLYVRGVGQQHWYDNFTGPVAVYTDGVYANRSAGQLLEAFDLERAELRPGPQGSLYARNATAGALLLRSRRPDGEFSGHFAMGGGNYRALAWDGAVGFPIAGDVVSARVAGTAHFRDGTTQNACRNTAPYDPIANLEPMCDLNGSVYEMTGRVDLFPVGALGDFRGLENRTNDVRDWAWRGLVRIRPSPTQDWLLKVHGERNRGDSRHLQMLGTQGQQGVNQVNFSEDSPPRYDTDPFVGWYDQDGDDRLDRFGLSLTGHIDLGDARVSPILSYVHRKHRIQDEGDATPDVALATDWNDQTQQVNLELHAEGGGRDHAWSTGVELLAEHFESKNLFKTSTLDYREQSVDERLLSLAPYVHALWQFTAHWSAELGVRYTIEWKKIEFESALQTWSRRELEPNVYASGWDTCCERLAELSFPPALDDEGSWAAATGELALHYAPADDLRFTARYTRGRKGAQFYGYSSTYDRGLFTAKPEFVHAGELALRSGWLDGALSFDAAFFYADYEDMQVFDFANEVDKDGMRQLLNADARVLGVDAEFVFRPLPGLSALVGFGWLDAEYRHFSQYKQVRPRFARSGALPTHELFDYSGNPLAGAPRYRLSGRVDYRLALGRAGALLPSFAFRYRSKAYFDVQENELLSQGAYWVLDARLAWRAPGDAVEIAGWVRNLTDEHYFTDAFDQSLELKQILYVYADPRLYGGSISVRF